MPHFFVCVNKTLELKSLTTLVEYNAIELAMNSAITVGILARIRPDLSARSIENFMKPWCMRLATLVNLFVGFGFFTYSSNLCSIKQFLIVLSFQVR